MKLNMVNGKSVGEFRNQANKVALVKKIFISEQKFPCTSYVILSKFY